MRRFPGILIASLLAFALIVTGCATAPPPPGTSAFSGMVWTWSEQDNTVTLRRAAEEIRVKVTPDQLIGIRLYETRTFHGTLAPPKDLPLVMVEGQSTVVPRGPADESDVVGTVAAVDAGGIAVNTPQGAVRVWRATDGLAFTPGANVRVRMRVQALDVVVVQSQPGVAAAPSTMNPSASPRSEPGDYAVVIGRVLSVDPAGRLTVESPRGPVTVQVPNVTRYKVGDTVEVRTSVHPA